MVYLIASARLLFHICPMLVIIPRLSITIFEGLHCNWGCNFTKDLLTIFPGILTITNTAQIQSHSITNSVLQSLSQLRLQFTIEFPNCLHYQASAIPHNASIVWKPVACWRFLCMSFWLPAWDSTLVTPNPHPTVGTIVLIYVLLLKYFYLED